MIQASPSCSVQAKRPTAREPEHAFGPYEVLTSPGSVGGTVVVFNSLGNPPRRMKSWEFWGQVCSAAPDWQIIAVRDQSRSWFNAEPSALRDLAAWLKETTDLGPGERVVTLGSSVGGFGAILFAQWLKADTCIALSPQIAVGRSLTAGSDPRWSHFIPPDEALVNSAVAAVPGCTYHVVYPAFDLLDVWQSSLLRAQKSFFYARLTEEHNCAAELKSQNDLTDFLRAAIAAPDVAVALPAAVQARFDFKGRTVKTVLRELKAAADARMTFEDWCAAADVTEPFDTLFLPYWCHALGDALTEEDTAGLSDGQLLSLLKRFPSQRLAEMARARRKSRQEKPATAKGWLTTWRAWGKDGSTISALLQSGWSVCEPWGAWSLGLVSELSLPVTLVPGAHYRLRLMVRPPPAAGAVGLRLVLRVGLEVCATQDIDFTERADIVVNFTAPATAAPTVGITATVERTVCPLLDHPVYPDPRAYGFGLEAVSIGVR